LKYGTLVGAMVRTTAGTLVGEMARTTAGTLVGAMARTTVGAMVRTTSGTTVGAAAGGTAVRRGTGVATEEVAARARFFPDKKALFMG
jgi:hypothetical protein